MKLEEVKEKSVKIREEYHKLEELYHKTKWTVEEDALAFLTDAGIVGRLTMDKEGRWPSENSYQLEEKIGECVWWLAVLAERMNLSFEKCVEKFLNSKKSMIEK